MQNNQHGTSASTTEYVLGTLRLAPQHALQRILVMPAISDAIPETAKQ